MSWLRQLWRRVWRRSFADIPAFGMWKDRPESDEELLTELGGGWTESYWEELAR